MELPALLQPDKQTSARSLGQVRHDSILHSYLTLRSGVGILGTALPLLLLAGDWLFVTGNMSARGSLSAYYYSGMRDIFVGILFAIAPLLITYKLFERNRDNTLSIVAGIFALGVAVFPTGRPSGSTASLTPLQDRLGEGRVEIFHYVFAATFIVCLMIISQGFADREADREQHRHGYDARFSPRFWCWFHRLANVAIVAAVAFIVITQILDVFGGYALLIGESVICIAFGASWLMKGMELGVLRQAGSAAPLMAEPSPVAGD